MGMYDSGPPKHDKNGSMHDLGFPKHYKDNGVSTIPTRELVNLYLGVFCRYFCSILGGFLRMKNIGQV